jgi:hypothetical protein
VLSEEDSTEMDDINKQSYEEIVGKFRESGLSTSRFCEQSGCKPGLLQYALYKVRKPEGDGSFAKVESRDDDLVYLYVGKGKVRIAIGRDDLVSLLREIL